MDARITNSSALHLASARGYIQISRVLLEHGADGNVQDTNGNASIHLAAEEVHVGVLRLLIKPGEVDPNIENNYGDTMLQLAAFENAVGIVHLLIGHGANIQTAMEIPCYTLLPTKTISKLASNDGTREDRSKHSKQ